MKTITICGSGKVKPLIRAVSEQLTSEQLLVLEPPLHDIDGLMKGVSQEGVLLAWKGATYAHFARILKCDVCLMVNAGGYLGVSSTLELGYAAALGKPIFALQHDSELARDVLFDFVLGTEDPPAIARMVSAKLQRGSWQ